MSKSSRRNRIKRRLTKREQMSEAFILAAFLAFSGGFQDAYTYMLRDHVFSNAETGNIVLMFTHLMGGEFRLAASYLFPILAFALGVFLAEQVQHRYKYARRIHWRQAILLFEIAILFAVGFMPVGPMNILASSLVSFSCAMQVQSFRKVAGHSYASTMCIGNLRSGIAAVSAYMQDHKAQQMEQASYYFAVILIFGIGAGVGGNCSVILGVKSIWICCILLTVALGLMYLDADHVVE